MFIRTLARMTVLAITVALSNARAADTIKIGYIGSLSGLAAFQGEQQLRGFHVAADYVNSERSLPGGRKFEIITFDNKGTPQEALTVLKQANLKANFYTLLAPLAGSPAAIGSTGADRVKSIASWHMNATDPVWEKRLLQAAVKYKANTDMAYIPPVRTLDMLAAAINKAGTIDPLKVAFALEGAKHVGPTGESWMRAEDYQLIAPVYIVSFMKAGKIPVKQDVEGTGFGWRTDGVVQAKDINPPIRCQMERPRQ